MLKKPHMFEFIILSDSGLYYGLQSSVKIITVMNVKNMLVVSIRLPNVDSMISMLKIINLFYGKYLIKATSLLLV